MNFIDFDWSKVENIWEKWWRKELGRPLFSINTPSAIPLAEYNDYLFHLTAQYDFSVPAEKFVDDILQYTLRFKHRDGSYPRTWINFGAGVIVALTGGKGKIGENTVWFEPGKYAGSEITDISLKLDKSCEWFKRIEEFFVETVKKFKGNVNIGMTDLGGAMDILSAFRPGEQLMFDMYDNPNEVKRLIWEIHDAWFGAFQHFNNILKDSNHGYSNWTGMFSKESHAVFQSDFAYMISPDDFCEFALPELQACFRKVKHSLYHLDGKGQLAHLDHLLELPELDCIQWVPGAGMPKCDEWPEVYQKIEHAGKLSQVLVEQDVGIIEKVLKQVKHPELLLFTGTINEDQEERLEAIYRQYGI